MSKGVIIVVEDDVVLAKLYQRALGAQGYSVMTAETGEAAVDLFFTVTPKLILLDVGLPKMSGIEVCRRAKSAFGDAVPILVQTARDDPDTVRRCVEAGADDYIIKGASIGMTIERIQYWCGAGRAAGGRQYKRRRALDTIADPVAGWQPPPEVAAAAAKAAAESAGASEEHLVKLTHLVAKALVVSPDFGKSRDQRSYFLGYVAGLVEHWLAAEGTEEAALPQAFRATLLKSGLVDEGDADRAVARLTELAEDDVMAAGRWRGAQDCAGARAEGASYRLRGLLDFADSQGAAA